MMCRKKAKERKVKQTSIASAIEGTRNSNSKARIPSRKQDTALNIQSMNREGIGESAGLGIQRRSQPKKSVYQPLS